MTKDNFDIENQTFEEINLPDEMRTSFLDYAMSVIVARALPDVRDGLKPVHRRILYGMNELGVTPEKPHKKSARIVGDVMGKYHPHGDSAIYEAMVRMAQPFSYRQMLVDGHGNFGSVDGDGAAAMRYTEARMAKITLEMLRDINKDTIDFQDNYSQEEREPVVLPSRFPNILINGASGIAVGMTTNIPPHNLKEVIDALQILMKDPEAPVEELMEVLPGPDFPTGGIIVGKSGIRRAYKTGKGKVIVRGKVEIENFGQNMDRERILIKELPYGVNKAKLVERIAELARDKRIEGITYIADESGREGMRVVVEIRRDTSAHVVLNNLYKQTALQTNFGINMLAIDFGVPKILNLKEILEKYLAHQVTVITRRTKFEKRKAEDRAHILEGLQKALDVIDEIISIIRSSRDSEMAKQELISQYQFTDVQAQSILDMRLVRLTGLEREKIDQELSDLKELIARLTEILGSKERIYEIIYDELRDIQKRFNDPRRTEIQAGEIQSLEDEDLIDEEDIIIALTTSGYIKRITEDEFHVQNRGGRGVKGMGVSDEDSIQSLVTATTHDTLLFFTNLGKVYRTKGYDVPQFGRTSKGLPIVNLLNLEEHEYVREIVNVKREAGEDEEYLFFVTKKGIVKRTKTSEYFNIRTNGLIAIKLREEDELMNVLMTDGLQNIIIGSSNGYAVTFKETDARSMGRTASGVRGMKLRKQDDVIGASILDNNKQILVVTENGYGKRTDADQYTVKNRGGKGVKTVNVSEKSGKLIGLVSVSGDEDLLVMTNEGIMIRIHVKSISVSARATLGVKVIKLNSQSYVSKIAIIENSQEAEETEAIVEKEISNHIQEEELMTHSEKDLSQSQQDQVEKLLDRSMNENIEEENNNN
ncbi:DNA gyrase subunit A [Facklamia sp. DSM 111018]|uniref:DNA gyrase subunit A n=1 Tax=Facklamia lactis TaxID=2749967 RepID=A0ABS0LV93_9LACT|nr:DNA gyrase subunit A [Facklamia lactis]MBG9981310.1 DNA gyrase subunit A [Facklamia lactis]MBG9987214.1 DNA gyrase subunit A [Facklamia lactis]